MDVKRAADLLMIRSHELKILPQYYQAVVNREKNFEIRKNDRDFRVGDIVYLKEWYPEGRYTGRYVTARITYITDYGQPEGQVVFGFKYLDDVR